MNTTQLKKIIPPLNIAALLFLSITLLMVFFFAPEERTMGNVQRIFYFHVGSAWVASIAYFVALVAGAIYLYKPSPFIDAIAIGSVEIGLVFTSMTIVSGSIWGKPAWNTWWLWSPRLTFITIMWLIYAAYFMLRGAVEDPVKRKRFAAIYVIIAFASVILTYFSVRLLRDIHPVVFGGVFESAQGSEQGLQEFTGLDSRDMGITVSMATFAFSLLYAAWLANRIYLQLLIDQVDEMKSKLWQRLQG